MLQYIFYLFHSTAMVVLVHVSMCTPNTGPCLEACANALSMCQSQYANRKQKLECEKLLYHFSLLFSKICSIMD
jgi:hypothetical protein